MDTIHKLTRYAVRTGEADFWGSTRLYCRRSAAQRRANRVNYWRRNTEGSYQAHVVPVTCTVPMVRVVVKEGEYLA